MDVMTLPASRDQSRSGSDLIAPDCRGLNFWTLDRSVRDLLALNLDARALAHFEPHFEKFGRVAGGRLDELAMQADKRVPVLHHRDRFGRDVDWVEYHPSYREREEIGFAELGLHASTIDTFNNVALNRFFHAGIGMDDIPLHAWGRREGRSRRHFADYRAVQIAHYLFHPRIRS
jgi:hypothetical protein